MSAMYAAAKVSFANHFLCIVKIKYSKAPRLLAVGGVAERLLRTRNKDHFAKGEER